jgi:hypothetical protein
VTVGAADRSPTDGNRWLLAVRVVATRGLDLSATGRTIVVVLSFLRPGRRRAEAVSGSRSVAAAVESFWQRWSVLRPDVAAALDADDTDLIEARVAAAVSALDRRLGWSVGTGERARYALMITGEGDQRLRALTDAWLAAAPPVDADWEYHDSAPAHDDPSEVTLAIADHQVPLSEIRVAAHPVGELIHVEVFHPLMAQLQGADRDALSFVPLDVTLGERMVEQRIGRVEPVEAEPADALDLLGLRELVTSLEPGDQRIGATAH